MFIFDLTKQKIMIENLFTSVMTNDEVKNIESIKKNKAFALRLFMDLSQVYTIHEKIVDNPNSSVIKMAAVINYNPRANFTANEKGTFFQSDVLDYYNRIGDLYERYKIDGTKLKNGREFTYGQQEDVSFRISLSENDPQLTQKLRDIMFLFERQQYNKKF